MERLHFQPITLDSREEITRFTLQSKSQICDLSFANL